MIFGRYSERFFQHRHRFQIERERVDLSNLNLVNTHPNNGLNIDLVPPFYWNVDKWQISVTNPKGGRISHTVDTGFYRTESFRSFINETSNIPFEVMPRAPRGFGYHFQQEPEFSGDSSFQLIVELHQPLVAFDNSGTYNFPILVPDFSYVAIYEEPRENASHIIGVYVEYGTLGVTAPVLIRQHRRSDLAPVLNPLSLINQSFHTEEVTTNFDEQPSPFNIAIKPIPFT